MPPVTSAILCVTGSATTTARSSRSAPVSASSPATSRSRARGSMPSKPPGSTANAASSKPTACSPSTSLLTVSPMPTPVPMSLISSCPKRAPDHALDVDVERVRVAREMIGPRSRLGLDANNAWRTPSEALRFARAVEKYEPWWLEEPLLPDDIEGHAQIAAALDWPVATGEIHSSRWDFRALIEKRAADILQPDAGVLGGVGEWMRVAHAAATFDIPVAPHWHADIHVHLVAAVPNALTVEYFSLDENIYNFERVLLDRLQPKEGMIPLRDAPGVGLELDRAAVERYRIG